MPLQTESGWLKLGDKGQARATILNGHEASPCGNEQILCVSIDGGGLGL